MLAVATFASVRSANEAARVAEQALLVGLRPLLLPSGNDDEMQKARFGDGRYAPQRRAFGRRRRRRRGIPGHLAAPRRHRHRRDPRLALAAGCAREWPPPEPDSFRAQTRDLYVSPGVVGFWQGAIRDTGDPEHAALCSAIASGGLIGIDLLYGDRDAGQRTISRFVLERPAGAQEWLTSVVRHWSIDGPRIG